MKRDPHGSGSRVRVGISGWTYPPWRGVFYPAGLPQHRELAYAGRHFSSIEINGTFYSMQRPECFRSWAADAPADFAFAVKGGRFITHMKKLKDVEVPLANFFASGVLALGDKLGPILWQLAPRFRFDEARLAGFLDLLPHDTEEAARLAQNHDARVAGRALCETDRRRPLRHAIEVRHESFRDPRFVDLLRRNGVALVVSDGGAGWPLYEDVTADFVYLRLHGAEELYASGYDGPALDFWAARIAAWAAGGEPGDARRADPATSAPRTPAGRDVYVYFDNDAKIRAPFDAAALMRRLGLPTAVAGAMEAGAVA
jgi:uncharacterized protein YecE (DUF72 family)